MSMLRFRAGHGNAGVGNSQCSTCHRMPRDLDNAYLKLNLPGSPLPSNGLLVPGTLMSADAQIEYGQMLNFHCIQKQIKLDSSS